MNREEYAVLIQAKLAAEADRMRQEFPENAVQSCYIDNLLPEELALEIYKSFPDKSTMMLKKSLRENKYVAAQMNEYNPVLEEIVTHFRTQVFLSRLRRSRAFKRWFRTIVFMREGLA